MAIHAWWVWRFRSGQIVDIDEAGYMTFALNAVSGFEREGLAGMWEAVNHQGPYPPLVSLATVPLVSVVGRGFARLFLVQLPFLVVLVVATFGLGRRLAGTWSGWVAAVTVATIPSVVDFSRTFHFVIPSAALFVASLYALLRTEGMSVRIWSLVFGALAGLTLLSRAMMLALVPGLLLAAVVVWLRDDRRWQRSGNLAMALAVAVLVAGAWYLPNLGVVLDYLVPYGYGRPSTMYGEQHPLLSAGFWFGELGRMVRQDLLLPLAILLATGLVVRVVLLVRRLRGRPLSEMVRTVVASPSFVVVTPLSFGYLALASSPNDGTGFTVALVPLVVLLAVAGFARLPRTPRVVTGSLLALIAALNMGIKTNLVPGLSGSPQIRLPAVGWTFIWTSSSRISSYLVQSGGYSALSAAEPVPPVHRRWLPTAARMVREIHRQGKRAGMTPVTLVSVRDPLLNSNTLNLAARLHLDTTVFTGHLEPRTGSGSVVQFRSQLQHANVFLDVHPGPRAFDPRVNTVAARAAARSLGFRPTRRFHLPNGRPATIWWRITPRPTS